MKRESNGCLVCGGAVLARGLCTNCHRAAMRELKAGTPEDELISAGLLLPKKKPAGRQSQWRMAAKKAGVRLANDNASETTSDADENAPK